MVTVVAGEPAPLLVVLVFDVDDFIVTGFNLMDPGPWLLLISLEILNPANFPFKPLRWDGNEDSSKSRLLFVSPLPNFDDVVMVRVVVV